MKKNNEVAVIIIFIFRIVVTHTFRNSVFHIREWFKLSLVLPLVQYVYYSLKYFQRVDFRDWYTDKTTTRCFKWERRHVSRASAITVIVSVLAGNTDVHFRCRASSIGKEIGNTWILYTVHIRSSYSSIRSFILICNIIYLFNQIWV